MKSIFVCCLVLTSLVAFTLAVTVEFNPQNIRPPARYIPTINPLGLHHRYEVTENIIGDRTTKRYVHPFFANRYPRRAE